MSKYKPSNTGHTKYYTEIIAIITKAIITLAVITITVITTATTTTTTMIIFHLRVRLPVFVGCLRLRLRCFLRPCLSLQPSSFSSHIIIHFRGSRARYQMNDLQRGGGSTKRNRSSELVKMAESSCRISSQRDIDLHRSQAGSRRRWSSVLLQHCDSNTSSSRLPAPAEWPLSDVWQRYAALGHMIQPCLSMVGLLNMRRPVQNKLFDLFERNK